MGRRRARVRAVPAAVDDDLPVSVRVARAYLAALAAGVVTGLLVVLSDQTLAVVACAGASGVDDAVATCRFGAAVWVGLAGFLLCLLPAVLALGLGVWTWLAMATAGAFLVAADSLTEWWWWLLAAVIPAVAAPAGAEWGERIRRGRPAVLLVLAGAAVATLARWYLTG